MPNNKGNVNKAYQTLRIGYVKFYYMNPEFVNISRN